MFHVEVILVVRDAAGNPVAPARSETIAALGPVLPDLEGLLFSALSAVGAYLEGRGTPAPFFLRAQLAARAALEAPGTRRALRLASAVLGAGAERLAELSARSRGAAEVPDPDARIP